MSRDSVKKCLIIQGDLCTKIYSRPVVHIAIALAESLGTKKIPVRIQYAQLLDTSMEDILTSILGSCSFQCTIVTEFKLCAYGVFSYEPVSLPRNMIVWMLNECGSHIATSELIPRAHSHSSHIRATSKNKNPKAINLGANW